MPYRIPDPFKKSPSFFTLPQPHPPPTVHKSASQPSQRPITMLIHLKSEITISFYNLNQTHHQQMRPTSTNQTADSDDSMPFDDDDSCQVHDDDYNPRTVNSRRKHANVRKRANPHKKFKQSLWELQENVSYMAFLLKNRDLFDCNRTERRAIKINVLMSQAVGTRSPDQCRSHHQKMMQYHKDIPNIVAHIQGLQQDQGQVLEGEPFPVTEGCRLPEVSLIDMSEMQLSFCLEQKENAQNRNPWIFDWETLIKL